MIKVTKRGFEYQFYGHCNQNQLKLKRKIIKRKIQRFVVLFRFELFFFYFFYSCLGGHLELIDKLSI